MKIKYVDKVPYWGAVVDMETWDCDGECETCEEKCEDAIECPSCGTWYDRYSKTCPNCGHEKEE